MGRFGLPNGPQPRAHLIFCQYPESQVLIKGTIPWHMIKRSERHSLQAALLGPPANLGYQRASDALALALGDDADLIDVSSIIDFTNQHEADDGPVGIVHGYPGEPGVEVRSEGLDRHQLGIGNVVETHFSEALTARALDLTESRDFVGQGGTDRDGHFLKGAIPLEGGRSCASSLKPAAVGLSSRPPDRPPAV
jgi:hypothetical protein